MKLKATGAQNYDKGSKNGGGNDDRLPWIRDRDLVGYVIDIQEIRPRHVEHHFAPNGAEIFERDEYIIRFSFPDEADAAAAFLGNYKPHGEYLVSTGAKRIRDVLDHVEEHMLPLENVVIFVDESSKYQQLYLADAEDGEPAQRPTETTPARPTGSAPAMGASSVSQSRDSSAQSKSVLPPNFHRESRERQQTGKR